MPEPSTSPSRRPPPSPTSASLFIIPHSPRNLTVSVITKSPFHLLPSKTVGANHPLPTSLVNKHHRPNPICLLPRRRTQTHHDWTSFLLTRFDISDISVVCWLPVLSVFNRFNLSQILRRNHCDCVVITVMAVIGY